MAGLEPRDQLGVGGPRGELLSLRQLLGLVLALLDYITRRPPVYVAEVRQQVADLPARAGRDAGMQSCLLGGGRKLDAFALQGENVRRWLHAQHDASRERHWGHGCRNDDTRSNSVLPDGRGRAPGQARTGPTGRLRTGGQ